MLNSVLDALDCQETIHEETMTAQRDNLIQMIEQNDQKHEEAHRRLRQDLDKLEEQVNKGLESLRERAQANRLKLEEIERLPVDATKLILRTPVVVTIVAFVLAIAGAGWAIKSSVD